ncbi:MAG: hypothetical protein IT292_07970 [Deltaproteobacteria bacterium]|nr:hypothetical protein [Deltaproteobacteria bacterium]
MRQKPFQADNFLKANSYQLLALITINIIWFLRCRDRLIVADFWAEDGTVFFQQAIEKGWQSLFSSYGGYYHLLPRLIAFGASYLPFTLAVYLIPFLAFIFAGYVFSLLLHKDYNQIAPDFFTRFCLCILLTLTPGLGEIACNITGLHWICWVYLALISVRNIDASTSYAKLFLILVCVLTEGATILLLPVFIYRFYLTVQTPQAKTECTKLALIILSISASSLLNYLHRIPETNLNTELGYLSLIWLKASTSGLFFETWIKDIIYQISSLAVLFITLACWLLVVRSAAICATAESKLFTMLALCASFWPLFITMARNKAGYLFMYHLPWPQWEDFRYAFILPAISPLILATIARLILGKNRKLYMVSIFILMIIASYRATDRFNIKAYSSDPQWRYYSDQVNALLSNNTTGQIQIPISPSGWSMDLSNKAN